MDEKLLELQHEFTIELSNLFVIFESSNKAFLLYKELKEVTSEREQTYIQNNNHILLFDTHYGNSVSLRFSL